MSQNDLQQWGYQTAELFKLVIGQLESEVARCHECINEINRSGSSVVRALSRDVKHLGTRIETLEHKPEKTLYAAVNICSIVGTLISVGALIVAVVALRLKGG